MRDRVPSQLLNGVASSGYHILLIETASPILQQIVLTARRLILITLCCMKMLPSRRPHHLRLALLHTWYLCCRLPRPVRP